MNEVKRYKLLQSVCYDDGAFVIPAGQVMVTASAHDDVVQVLRAENARLRRGLENCHMLARRIVASESTFFKIDSANHIIRMCEEAGVTSVKGVLRDAALQPERGKK